MNLSDFQLIVIICLFMIVFLLAVIALATAWSYSSLKDIKRQLRSLTDRNRYNI